MVKMTHRVIGTQFDIAPIPLTAIFCCSETKPVVRSTMLQHNLNELIERKVAVMNELRSLRDKIDNEGVKAAVDKLVLLKKSLKELEREENEAESVSNSELDAEVRELEEQLENGCDSQSLCERLNRLLSESEEDVDSAKKELAARLRAVLAVQRKIDDVPCQSELIQYDHRLSELNAQIQGKLRQTRKYYATYNALLEIKEMMLKEASLLNSISSQFQDAITSTDGRMKLINSMEGIMKGSQQKLKKVEHGLQEEQKACDALKAKHVAATAEQRRCYSLLKAFREESAKNELLKKKTPARTSVKHLKWRFSTHSCHGSSADETTDMTD